MILRTHLPRDIGQRPAQHIEIMRQRRRHKRKRDMNVAVVEIVDAACRKHLQPGLRQCRHIARLAAHQAKRLAVDSDQAHQRMLMVRPMPRDIIREPIGFRPNAEIRIAGHKRHGGRTKGGRQRFRRRRRCCKRAHQNAACNCRNSAGLPCANGLGSKPAHRWIPRGGKRAAEADSMAAGSEIRQTAIILVATSRVNQARPGIDTRPDGHNNHRAQANGCRDRLTRSEYSNIVIGVTRAKDRGSSISRGERGSSDRDLVGRPRSERT